MSVCPYGLSVLSLNDTQVLFKFSNDCNGGPTQVNIFYNGVDMDYFKDKTYNYHIHINPVTGGNCTSTGGHYDPLTANKSPQMEYVCNKDDTSTCEKGDLSGKHGPLKLTDGEASYVDSTFDLNEIIGRSVVIHAPDKSRIACNDINQISI